MTNIFDIYDLNDIPEELKEDLRKDPFGDELVQLFKLANRALTVDEVYIGHYRKFVFGTNREPKTKRQIMLKLYHMGKDKNSPIESTAGKKGSYQLKFPLNDLFSVEK